MSNSFFFYDLETSGISPKYARIMQFAGQRTDMDLKPIGEPVKMYIKLSPDTLPEPDAIMLTKITPQQTISEGVSEADFLNYFYKNVVKPNTTFVGFNSVRFDDEFMRYLNYRNFYDAYGWQWQNGCSRWDILDLVRMTRALRPSGIKWPFAPDGKPTNRLEFLTSVNKIKHVGAHDALSDVLATIGVSQLIKTTQPDLFSYLFKLRSKREVKALVGTDQPFIYTSGHFSSEVLHTTVCVKLMDHPGPDAAIVFDLSVDPTPYLKMDAKELVAAWQSREPDRVRIPLKTLKYNRVPALAPLGVVKDQETRDRLKIDLDKVKANLSLIHKNQTSLALVVSEAIRMMDESRNKEQLGLISDPQNVDFLLYEGFFPDSDQKAMQNISSKSNSSAEIASLKVEFKDERLNLLWPLYKARNFPKTLSSDEHLAWEAFCETKLTNGGESSVLAKYFQRLSELEQSTLNKEQQYLIEELKLYAQSIIP